MQSVFISCLHINSHFALIFVAELPFLLRMLPVDITARALCDECRFYRNDIATRVQLLFAFFIIYG